MNDWIECPTKQGYWWGISRDGQKEIFLVSGRTDVELRKWNVWSMGESGINKVGQMCDAGWQWRRVAEQ